MAFTQEKDTGGFVDKLVNIGRVAKVVKGGRRFSFSAIVVVGDESGRVGWGSGKAREVPEAVRKATDVAKKRMVRVPLREGRTIHHIARGEFGGAQVFMKPATPGTGIIAGGPMRAVFESMGMKDVVAKSLGSNNPYNLIQATFEAFASMETPRAIAAKRGLKISELRDRRSSIGFVGNEQQAEQPAPAAASGKKASSGKEESKPAAKKPAPAKKDTKKSDANPAEKASAKKTDPKKAAPKKEAKAKSEKAEPKKAAATKKAPAKKAASKATSAKESK